MRLRADWTRQQTQSDGYATGLIVFALQQVGMPASNPAVRHGLEWLARNQNGEDGTWPSTSINQRRNPSSNVGHFMRDASTAYAVLALSESASSVASAEENRSRKNPIAALSSKVNSAARGN
jgi:hypothetical protein